MNATERAHFTPLDGAAILSVGEVTVTLTKDQLRELLDDACAVYTELTADASPVDAEVWFD